MEAREMYSLIYLNYEFFKNNILIAIKFTCTLVSRFYLCNYTMHIGIHDTLYSPQIFFLTFRGTIGAINLAIFIFFYFFAYMVMMMNSSIFVHFPSHFKILLATPFCFFLFPLWNFSLFFLKKKNMFC